MTNLTKQEINLRIAKLVFPDATKVFNRNEHVTTDAATIFENILDNFDVDYCNNWNDLMPLVVKYEISFTPQPNNYGYVANNMYGATYIFNQNPQMALCLCLLKVLEAKEKSK